MTGTADKKQGHSIILLAFEWQKQLQFLRHFMLPNQSVICGLGTLSIASVWRVLLQGPPANSCLRCCFVAVKWSIRHRSWRCLQFLFHLPVNEHWKCVKWRPLCRPRLVFNCLQVVGMAFNEVLNDTSAFLWPPAESWLLAYYLARPKILISFRPADTFPARIE